MDKKLLEKMAEKVHDGWMKEKRKQGYHHPSKCPLERKGCMKCHEQMKPYNKLIDSVKELDRVMIREFEKNIKGLGYTILKKKEEQVRK